MNENDPGLNPVENEPAPPETPAPAPEPLPPLPGEAPAAAKPAVEDKTIIHIQTQEAPKREETPPVAPPPAAVGFWARPGWLAVALVGLASSCLAVVLTLAILGLVNRGLSYAAPADVSALQSQIDTLKTRVDSATQDLAGLRARVDQLEELAARTTELERMALDLQAEIDKRVTQAEELKGAVEDVQTKIADVITQSKAFQSFVDGLRDLINIFPKGQTP
jgi:cell division protein FtsL